MVLLAVTSIRYVVCRAVATRVAPQVVRLSALRPRSRSVLLAGTPAAYRTQQACFRRQPGRKGAT